MTNIILVISLTQLVLMIGGLTTMLLIAIKDLKKIN